MFRNLNLSEVIVTTCNMREVEIGLIERERNLSDFETAIPDDEAP